METKANAQHRKTDDDDGEEEKTTPTIHRIALSWIIDI